MNKPVAIKIGYSPYVNETVYKCPICHKHIGDLAIFTQDKNSNGTRDYCPYCKIELLFPCY